MREDYAKIIRDDVIAVIASSPTKISPSALEKQISARHGLSKKQIKTVIRDLVSTGEVTYTYDYGSSFLERSFSKPVRISKHIVLKAYFAKLLIVSSKSDLISSKSSHLLPFSSK